MSEFLFHVQWWIPTLLAVIGIVLFINGNKAQVSGVRNAGTGIVVLAVVWGVLSYFIDTDQEKVENGTRDALDALVAGKWDVFKQELAPAATFTIGSNSFRAGADDVTAYARDGAEYIKLKSAHIQNLTLDQTGSVITAHFEILSTQDFIQPVETSSWDFVWDKTPQGWKLRELRLVKLKDVENPGDVIPKGMHK